MPVITTEQTADEVRVQRVLKKIAAYRGLDVDSQLDQGLTGLSLTFTESTSLANWLARTINSKEETTD